MSKSATVIETRCHFFSHLGVSGITNLRVLSIKILLFSKEEKISDSTIKLALWKNIKMPYILNFCLQHESAVHYKDGSP